MKPDVTLLVVLAVLVAALIAGVLGVWIVHITFKGVLGLDIPEVFRELLKPKATPTDPEDQT